MGIQLPLVQLFGASKSDHKHLTGSTPTTTTLPGDTLMSGMTITPTAGKYLVVFSGDISIGTNNRPTAMNIYSGGVLVASSEIRFNTSSANQTIGSFCCRAVVTVNGAEAIEGRWRITNNATATNRYRIMTVQLVS